MAFESSWAFIPDIALIIIYKMVPNEDRFSMSVVCKNWNRLFRTPSLWTDFNLKIGGHYTETAEGQRNKSLKFVKKYGCHVKKLTLSWLNNPNLSFGYFRNVLSEFFHTHELLSAKLVEFRLLQTEFNCFWGYDCNQNRTVDDICKFLYFQKSLKVINFTSSQLTLTNGCKILKAIGLASGNVVEDLFIQDLFHQRLSVFSSPRFLNSIGLFNNLSQIFINYCCLSENIVNRWRVGLAGKLQYLAIAVNQREPHRHNISRKAWSGFLKACPGLEVKLVFANIKFDQIISVLVSDIPVKSLEFKCRDCEYLENMITSVLVHVSLTYWRTLKNLSVDFYNVDEPLDSAVLFIVEKCKSLEQLKINAIMKRSTVRAICRKKMKKKTNLAFLEVTSCGLNTETRNFLNHLMEKHYAISEVLETDFHFTVDSRLLIDIEQNLTPT